MLNCHHNSLDSGNCYGRGTLKLYRRFQGSIASSADLARLAADLL